MRMRKGFNPKRTIASPDLRGPDGWSKLADCVVYTGNPEHKLHPNDYGLTPPANPRPTKTLCDADGSLLKSVAESLIKKGLEKGIVSVQSQNGWPKNIWAVSESGNVYEAQLENKEQGHYHGYPMPMDDDFRRKVVKAWDES